MDGITIYESAFDICSAYDTDTQARLVGYMAMYALTGKEPEFDLDDPARYIWPALRDKADRTREAYEQKASAGRAGGKQTASRRQAEIEQDSSSDQAEVKQNSSTPQADLKQDASKIKPDTDTETDTETDIENETRAHARTRAREKNAETEKRFERFWTAYPRKVGKKEALKAFTRASPDDALLERMLTAVEKYKRSDQWTRDAGAFIPNPATWINQERWTDEIQTGHATPRTRTVPAQQYEQRDYSGENDDEEMARLVLRNAASARQSGVDVDALVRKYPEIAKKYGVIEIA